MFAFYVLRCNLCSHEWLACEKPESCPKCDRPAGATLYANSQSISLPD